jgi:hypothetical protein
MRCDGVCFSYRGSSMGGRAIADLLNEMSIEYTSNDGQLKGTFDLGAFLRDELLKRVERIGRTDKVPEPTSVAVPDPSGFPYSTDPDYEFGPVETTSRPTLDDLNKENGREFTTAIPAPEIEVGDLWVNQWLKARGIRFNTPVVLVFRDPKIAEKKRRRW